MAMDTDRTIMVTMMGMDTVMAGEVINDGVAVPAGVVIITTKTQME